MGGAQVRMRVVGGDNARLDERTAFRAYWFGQAISVAGDQVTLLAIPMLAVTALQADASRVALLSAVARVAFLVVSLPSGVWIDRVGRRKALVWADLIRASCLLVIVALAGLNHLTFEVLMAASFGLGVGTVLFQVAYPTFVPSLVSEPNLRHANARLAATESLVRVVGPSVAGVLLGIVGSVLGLVVDALSFLVSRKPWGGFHGSGELPQRSWPR